MTSGNLGILICGKIRDEGEFRAGVATYDKLKSSGLVSKIVFSGWESDLEQNRDCIYDAVAAGVEVVLSPEPSTLVRGNIFQQKKTLRYGLSRFADDQIVLRTRTDKAQLHLNLDDMMRCFDEQPPVATGSPFSRRILVLRGLAFHPFFYNDMLYTGAARDLRLLSTFDLWFEMQNCAINAEQALFSSPLIEKNDDVRDYFMINPGLIHDDPKLAMDVELTMLRSPFYRSILRKHLTNLLDNYGIGFTDMAPWVRPTERLTLAEIIARRDGLMVDGLMYAPGANSIEFARREAAAYLLSIPVSDDEPRSLIDLADEERFERRQMILQPAAAKLAGELSEIYRPMGRVAPTIEDGITIYHSRHSLLIP